MGFEAPVHKRYFDAVDRGPVRYIVLTQGHVDHVGGVDRFREPGTEIVAHANNPAQQAYDARLAPFRARRAPSPSREAVRAHGRDAPGGAAAGAVAADADDHCSRTATPSSSAARASS